VFATLLPIDFSVGLSDFHAAKVSWLAFVQDSLLVKRAIVVPCAASVCFLGEEWLGLHKFLLAELAVVSGGSHTLAIAAVLEEHAKISIEHELVLSRHQTSVNSCPLILERVTTHSELWAPAFEEKRFVVIVVENALLVRFAPKAVIS
jgi:hypothetical protein